MSACARVCSLDRIFEPPISLNQVQPDQRTEMIICQQMEPSQRAVRIKQPKHINENVISAIASATK